VNREEILLKEQRDSLLREAAQLTANPNATKADLKRADVLMAQASQMRSRDVMAVRAAAALESATGRHIEIETAEQRKAREERAMLRHVLSTNGEYRTYSPLASSGSPYVPEGFEKILVEAQMSAGPLFSGSPLVTNVYVTEGNPSKLPTLDDLSSTGFVVDENTTETDGVFSPKNVTLTLQKFSSGLTQYSMELAQYVEGFEGLTQVLGTAIGRRISRIQNSTFLAALLTTLGSNDSASLTSGTAGIITDGDVEDLVGEVNSAYATSSSAAFLMSRGAQTMLGKLKTSSGYPVFKKVLAAKPTLLGFPVYVSAFCDTVATGNKPVLFGDWSTVFIRSIQGFSIRTLTQRFADLGIFAMLASKRAAMAYGIQSTSDSAIKLLQIS
jgi:HK97 family phage major capsid protein